MNLPRLLRTVRHLKPEQLRHQVGGRARRAFESPASLLRRAVPPLPGLRGEPAEFPPPLHPNAAPDILRGRFRFLECAEETGWPPDWSAQPSKLWAYNLHYFDWMWSLDFAEARLAALDWIETHVPARGATGWEPYPISLRTMNWCGYFFARHRERILADERLAGALWRSLFLQTEWLAEHLEFHIGANHLMENAVALSMAGSTFKGTDADRWLARGTSLLAREIREQILADGMHFERSPMYHARMVHVFDALSRVGAAEAKRLVDAQLPRMREALACIAHPDGEIALLNDSAFGIYPPPAELGAEPSKAPRGAWALREAGYFGWRDDAGNYLVCDAAPIGPDHQPGHAHGDIFSFEWSIGGRRAVVDTGTFDYVAGEMRALCRSTRAHNTLEIDGADQCEFWGAFRTGRRGRPRGVQWQPSPDGFELGAAHDGYVHLGAVHARQFRWKAPGTLRIADTVEARKPGIIRRFLHFHPDCDIALESGRALRVEWKGGGMRIGWGSGEGRVAESWYCQRFGHREVKRLLCIEAPSARGTWRDEMCLEAICR